MKKLKYVAKVEVFNLIDGKYFNTFYHRKVEMAYLCYRFWREVGYSAILIYEKGEI